MSGTQRENRSELLPTTVQPLLNDAQRTQNVERYVKGYVEVPEQSEEVDELRWASYAALAEEPWD